VSDERRALGLLGLGLKAGRVAVGVEASHSALQRGKAEMLVMPKDASKRAREKLVMLAKHREVPVLVVADAGAIGAALGRPPVHGAAVLDRQLARGLRALVAAGDRGEMAAG
jgi:ribosomal protein L7Ae-like RNA K-turn-binding protein